MTARGRDEKAANFRRLMERRVPVALERLDLIGNLSQRSYAYSPAQAVFVIATLQAKLDEVARLFGVGCNGEQGGAFRLPE